MEPTHVSHRLGRYMPRYQFGEAVFASLRAAKGEAAQLGHDFVGPTHLVLGVLRALETQETMAGAILRTIPVNLEALAISLRSVIGGASPNRSTGEVEFTGRAVYVIELAIEESTQLKDDIVDTGHLLAGVLIAQSGASSSILHSFRITIDKIRLARKRITAHLGLSAVEPVGESPQLAELRRLGALHREYGSHLQSRSHFSIAADFDQVPSDLLVETMAALDLMHRAWGGAGLVIRGSAISSAIDAHATA